MLRQPIKATFTLSAGANGDDHTFSGITVATPIAVAATADFFRKFLLDGFIVLLLLVYWIAIYKIQLHKIRVQKKNVI
jgi:hypothetical protein